MDEFKYGHRLFMESLHQRLGPQAYWMNVVDLGGEGMPQYNPYEDESQKVETFPSFNEEPEATLEQSEMLFLRGNKMARGQAVHWKHDTNSNPIGRSNQNPVLDICLYEV